MVVNFDNADHNAESDQYKCEHQVLSEHWYDFARWGNVVDQDLNQVIVYQNVYF